MDELRKSAIAGSWYPGNPSVLKKDIEKYFQAVTDIELEGDIVGIVTPHAGYVYSGQVAAYAYKLICGKKYDVVIVIGPSHRHAFHGVSIYGKGAYETPLGIVPVDDVLALEIKALNKIVQDIPAAHVQEHSVEIQLPFLQVALGHFCFVPLVMGDQSVDTCRVLAEVIYQATRGKKTLVVGSSDLSHFHSYNEATKLDAIALQRLKNADAEGLLQSLVDEEAEACGGGPMAVAMMAAQKMGANKTKFLKYANSGDVTGDKSSVVGYAAVVYYK